jgi:hypothetical protein
MCAAPYFWELGTARYPIKSPVTQQAAKDTTIWLNHQSVGSGKDPAGGALKRPRFCAVSYGLHLGCEGIVVGLYVFGGRDHPDSANGRPVAGGGLLSGIGAYLGLVTVASSLGPAGGQGHTGADRRTTRGGLRHDHGAVGRPRDPGARTWAA